MANLLTGIDKLVADIAGPLLFASGKLARQARVADGRGGWSTSDTYEACQALVTEYSAFSRTSLNIPDTDRKVLVLGHGLASPPIPGNVIVVDGYRWRIVQTSRDPAKAVYECQATPDGTDRVIARSVMTIANPVLSALGKLRIAASGAMTIANPLLSSASRVAIAAAAAVVIGNPVLTASATIFSPDKLFAANETGAVYDPSDVTSLYQSLTTGATVTAGGQPVRIMLDKSRMGGKTAAEFIADQPELAGAGGWTATGTVSESAGTITFPNTTSSEITKGTGTTGQYYLVSFTVAATSGLLTFRCGTNSISTALGSGSYTYVVSMGAGGALTRFLNAGSFVGTVTNISTRHLPGFHYISPSDAARALYGREPVTGTRNLLFAQTANPTNAAQLTKSGDAASTLSIVSDAAALAAAGLSDRATNGTVFRLNNTAGTAAAFARFNHTLTLGGSTWSLSAFVRGTGTSQIDVNAGTWTGAGSFALTSEYQRRVSTGTSATSSNQWRIRAAAGSDVYFILAMAEVSAAPTNYQLALSALDVTESGVASRHFLQPDGVDDWGQVLPVCNLGESWSHVGGWNAFDQSDWFFTTSSDGGNGGTFLANSGRLCWRNSAIVNTRIGTDFDLRNVPAVCTIEQASTSSLSGRVNGAAGVSITPANDSGATQGLALFSLTNGAASNGLSGRFYGGTWINRVLTTGERRALEVWQAQKTGVAA